MPTTSNSAHPAPACQCISPSLWLFRSGAAGSQHPVNSYIWRADESTVIIDPAIDLTQTVLDSLGLPPVSDILFTHLQNEHAAGCLNFAGCRLHVPSDDEYLCEGIEAYRACIELWQPPWEWETRGNFRGHLAGALNERPLPSAVPLSTSLHDGDCICGLRVVATPGQGKNAVSLLGEIDGQRVAFCGDLIYGEGHLWNWFDCDWDYGPQTGQHTLLASAGLLAKAQSALLLPAHGPVISNPDSALVALRHRLEAILADVPGPGPTVNVPEQPSAPGFRRLSPHLHQWRNGNCAVLTDDAGHALLVDDGLCHWVPLPERAAHHRHVIETLKSALGINKVEVVIPTHYHGDHIENIPELVEMEGTEVVSLDIVAAPTVRPRDYHLACPLWWYGTCHENVPIDRVLSEGSVLQWRGYEIELFHLGGQTYYHCGLAVTVDGQRVLFTGDAIAGWDESCDPVLCYNDAEPAGRGWAYSVDRMLERDPDLLVGGHGVAIAAPLALLRAKQDNWRRRIAQFHELSARPDLRLFFDPFV